MYLQGPRHYGRHSTKPTVFQLNIHNPFSSADLRSSGIDVKAGYETTFLITSSQIDATNEVKDLAPDRRNCLFVDENEKLILFKY